MIASAFLGLFAVLSAVSDVVGIGVSSGAFRVSERIVQGTASIPAGEPVEAVDFGSRLLLRSGARVDLDGNSRVRIFDDRIVLESGHSRISGPARITNSQGVILAQLAPGRALDFAIGAYSTAMTQVSGILELRDGVYRLTDELTHVSFRISAKDAELAKRLQQAIGQKTQIEGVISQDLIQATRLVPQVVSAASSAATTAAAHAAGGVSKAVIAGVAIGGGAAGGLGVAMGKGDSKSTQTISQ